MVKHYVWDGTKAIPLSALTPERLTGDDSKSPQRIYDTVAWVRRCIQLRASAVSGLPFDITNERGEVVHPTWEVALPGLLWKAETALCVYGCAYWLKETVGNLVVGLRYLAPQTIEPRYDTAKGIVGYTRRVGGSEWRFLPKDIVAFYEPSPDVEVGPGRPLIKAALSAASIAYDANAYVSGFFERGAITALLLTVEGNPPDEEMRKLEAWWRQLLRGVRKAWESIAVRASVKPQPIGIAPGKDLDLEALYTSARQQIAVAFGVPQTLIEDSANYATAREHRLSFYHETVVPRALWLQGEMNQQLLAPMGYQIRFRPERLEIFQQDETAKAEAVVSLVNAGILTVEEAREMTGYGSRNRGLGEAGKSVGWVRR